MKRRPDLPPRLRGRVSRQLTSEAAFGRFRLPVCKGCGTVHYPVQEFCPHCLSDDLRWEAVADTGTVSALTKVHHSTDPYFQAQRPILMGSVKLDAGPVAIVRLAPECAAPGARVRIQNQLDRGGEAILCAVPVDDNAVRNIMADPNRDIAGKSVLVTGADGGIGSALVSAFVEAGAKQVFAATRKPVSDARPSVKPLIIDITRPESVEAAARAVGGEVDILVNNAGITADSGVLDAETLDGARLEMEVNYFGTLSMIRAFAPFMKARRQGVVVNMLTVLSHVPVPRLGSYCASKAAALSMTQAARAELAPWGIRVCGMFPGTVDTKATRDSPPPKLAPAQVAAAVVKSIRDGIEDHYPGAMARDLFAAWRENSKVVERELANMLPEPR